MQVRPAASAPLAYASDQLMVVDSPVVIDEAARGRANRIAR